MNLISTFLERFKKLSPPESALRTAFINAVQSVLKIKISPEQVRVRHEVVYFEGSSLLRSEFMLKKKELLAQANQELQLFSRRITEIR